MIKIRSWGKMKSDSVEKKVLIIDDEAPLRELYHRRLTRKGYAAKGVASAEEGLILLGSEIFHVALVDIRMPGMNGIDFLDRAQKRYPMLVVIMMTAYGSIESAVKAMKLGAYDYLTKPCSLPELELIVEKGIEKSRLENENLLLKQELRSKDPYDRLIYASLSMEKIMGDVEKVAPTGSPVIIEGESGTGKELVANSIHKKSQGREGSFITINCANLQEHLLENDLFGHEKGAYTGADSQKRGLVELADQGTLFIDEIGEMPRPAQAKLLRVLENGTFRRIGGNNEIKAKVRIITATNRNLEEEVAKRNFRDDLYFRLNVVRLTLPPLRERGDDVLLLADHFLEKKNNLLNRSKKFGPGVNELFKEYSWPGNVRELANIVERAVILSSGEFITPADIPIEKGRRNKSQALPLKQLERDHIEKVLLMAKGNKTQAAEILGISLRNLYRKLDLYKSEDSGG
jgi:two-component system response regulator AtoC